MNSAQIDPLNPKHFLDPQSADVPQYSGMSILEMPDAPSQPWLEPRKRVPAGKIDKYELKSDLLNNNRDVYVYTPPGYSKDAKPYALAVLFDAFAYFDKEATPTPIRLPMSSAKRRGRSSEISRRPKNQSQLVATQTKRDLLVCIIARFALSCLKGRRAH